MMGEQVKVGRQWLSGKWLTLKGKVMLPEKPSTGRFVSAQGRFGQSSRTIGSVLRWTSGSSHMHPRLRNERVYLRYPGKDDYAKWAHLRAASADFLRPWEPIWPRDDLAPQGFRRRIEQYQKDRRAGRSLPYLLFRSDDHHLLGGVNVSNIRRGICQSASLGYWMGENYAGQGYMTDALALLLPYLFDCQGLHRVEAACLPINQASIAVLKKQGFRQEGFARSYLCINGRWEDHLLFAALRSDIDQPSI